MILKLKVTFINKRAIRKDALYTVFYQVSVFTGLIVINSAAARAVVGF